MIEFKCAADAVTWADNFMMRDPLRSQFDQIAQTPAGRSPGPGLSDRDLAETISVCLSSVAAPPGTIYRHVYGRYPHTLQLADDLAHRVWDGPGRVRTIGTMRVLSALMIEDARKRARYDEKIKKKDIARQLGVSRDCYYDNWARYADAMSGIIRDWLEIADRALGEDLADRGIL